MRQISQAQIHEALQSQPIPKYMRQYIKQNQCIAIMVYRMLIREGKSWTTLKRYFEAIHKFSVYIGVDKDDADKALNKLKKSEEPTDIIDDYIAHLQRKKYSAPSIKNMFYGMKKWLETNQLGQNVYWDSISCPKVSSRIRDRVPTRNELQRILKGAKLRDTALFLTALSSGLRIGTVAHLKIKDVEWLEDYQVAKVNVQGGVGKKLGKDNWFYTFITGEAYQAVQDYWKTRRDIGPEDYVFLNNKGESFVGSVSSLTRKWRKLTAKAGLKKQIPNHNWTELHTHTLRKFFQTSCKRAGISPSYYDFWMGRISLRPEIPLEDSYFRARLDEHVNEYKKAISDLVVFQDLIIVESIRETQEGIKKLEEKNVELEEKNEWLEKKVFGLEYFLNLLKNEIMEAKAEGRFKPKYGVLPNGQLYEKHYEKQKKGET